jgi:hypothetical protein
MRKILLIAVLLMSVMAVNAQVDTTSKVMKKETRETKATPVKLAELPRAITETIARDYPDYSTKEASSIWENNALNYQVVVSKGTESETLVFDKDGKFLKKLPKKE